MQTVWVEAFLAVVDQRGFAAAAARLYRSQGRVSAYIAALETELGVRLFDRNQRPAQLTSEGSAFLPYAREMMGVLESGRLSALAVQGLAKGDVAVAAYPSASAAFIPLVLRTFSHEYPNVTVRLIDRQNRGLDRVLDQGEAHLAIRPSMPPLISRSPSSYQQLWREDICAVLEVGHPLAEKDEITMADLADEPLVFGGRSAEDAEVARLMATARVTPTIKFLSNQPQSVVALTRHGLATGIINVLALQSIRLDGVAVRPLVGVSREVGVFWTPAAESSAAAVALLRTIVATEPPAPSTDLRDAAARQFPELFA
ncbi:LysR family transcriptional regulator [Pseudonocardia sp. GCM10023141]|uniref:LysR family transcriptional regulator n=1 Tax=Pseudonocardia sp. GCM10023141 TaxID=3252653 RepID=UPI00360D8AEF